MEAKKSNSTVFNPVKQDVDGVKAMRAIWSTKVLEKALIGLQEGRKLTANPFYENNTRLLKGDLVFERTQEEIEEWKRCATDIIYFVNKYCKLMTPEGIKNVTLRDYQEKYLQHLMDNRLSIYLACRQCGKCLSPLTQLYVKFDVNGIFDIDDKLKTYLVSNYYSAEKECFIIPFFEIQNLYDKSKIWKVKYVLYKWIYDIEKHEKQQIKYT